MNIFPSNPAQKDSGDPKPSSLGPKFMMLVILTLVIGGLMWNFFQQGNDTPAGGSSILDGTPFDIPNPYSLASSSSRASRSPRSWPRRRHGTEPVTSSVSGRSMKRASST